VSFGSQGVVEAALEEIEAEFPNAWIKTKLKLTRFATRGLERVQCEAIWAAMTFNLQRMFRLAPT
jgi:hypothetical protein